MPKKASRLILDAYLFAHSKHNDKTVCFWNTPAARGLPPVFGTLARQETLPLTWWRLVGWVGLWLVGGLAGWVGWVGWLVGWVGWLAGWLLVSCWLVAGMVNWFR